MKISEYVILEDAFENAFGFMLNRIADATGVDLVDAGTNPDIQVRCFRELITALEEMGVTLQDLTNE